MVALFASKDSLIGSVSLFTMPANRTGARRVVWVNQHNWHTRQLCLVLHETPQLAEPPITKLSPKACRNRFLDAPANSREVFERDTDAECLCFRNDLLANTVVFMSLKASLSSSHLLQSSFSVLRPLSLVLLSSCSTPTPITVNVITRETLSYTICGDIDNAKVYSKEVRNFKGWGLVGFNADVEKEQTVPMNQISLSHLVSKVLSLVISTDEWHFESPLERCDAGCVTFQSIKKTVIQRNGAVRKKYGADSTVAEKGINRFADTTDSQLGRQTKRFTQVIVAEPMNVELLEGAVCVTDLSSASCCGVASM